MTVLHRNGSVPVDPAATAPQQDRAGQPAMSPPGWVPRTRAGRRATAPPVPALSPAAGANGLAMTPNTLRRMTVISASVASTPRLRMEPTGSRRTLLDGGWWPRSTDPVAELPGLVLAIDKLRGPVTRLVLSADGWDQHPRRLGVAGRVLRLGYFASQPTSLLIALCDNGDRVDLLIVPPDTDAGTADAAMVLAATTSNLVHAQHILVAAGTAGTHGTDSVSDSVWETDGGRLRSTSNSARLSAPPGEPGGHGRVTRGMRKGHHG